MYVYIKNKNRTKQQKFLCGVSFSMCSFNWIKNKAIWANGIAE